MAKVDPIEEVKDLLKKHLILKLYFLNLSQTTISKKLHIDVHTVNNFLKGIKRNNYEKEKRVKK